VRRLPAVVWPEQTARRSSAADAEDGRAQARGARGRRYDGDGDIDLVTGNMATTGPIAARVELWESQSQRPRGTKTHGDKP
jgi:hypothetical protein